MTVVWITGLPASGKSTLALRLQRQLARAVVLDGDEVRDALDVHDYTPDARDAFYHALAGLAGLIARQGTVAIVAATAPRRQHRWRAKARAPRFIEVFVDTPREQCAVRDPKGLYAAARRGELEDMPGAGADYERPTSPDVIAHGGEDDVAVAQIVDLLRG